VARNTFACAALPLAAQGFREELRTKQTISLLLSQEAEKVPEPSDSLREQLWRARRERQMQALVNRRRGQARIETFL
jgi:hypothetical protein